jgi:hypothetical protein
MPKHKKFQYLLTFVDTLTGWIEAIPMAQKGLQLYPTLLSVTSFPVSVFHKVSSWTMALPSSPGSPNWSVNT